MSPRSDWTISDSTGLWNGIGPDLMSVLAHKYSYTKLVN